MAFNDSIVETNKIAIVTLEIKLIDNSKYSGFLAIRGVHEKLDLQLNEYETVLYFLQLSQILKWGYLLISVNLPVLPVFA